MPRLLLTVHPSVFTFLGCIKYEIFYANVVSGDKMTTRPPPKVVAEKHEVYRTIIVNGVYGGHRPGFFEAIVYTDEMIADEALSTIPEDATKVYIKRLLQCRLVMDLFKPKVWRNGYPGILANMKKPLEK